ncbi:phosphocholine cytidylyltransferase family protein [Thalassotalea ganghwensis]
MKAIILAAGTGNRLRPLTDNTPKSMVKLWGEPLLTKQIKQLKLFGINDITIITGYCQDKIIALGEKTISNPDFASSNMVYSLAKSCAQLENTSSDALVLYGDIAYSDNNLKALINCQSTCPMTVLANLDWLELWRERLEDPLSDAETFIYDETMKLVDIGKRPENLAQVQAQYMGMIKAKESYLKEILTDYLAQASTPEIINMYMTDLIQQCCDEQQVQVELVHGGWIEMDTIEDYQLYSQTHPSYWGISS